MRKSVGMFCAALVMGAFCGNALGNAEQVARSKDPNQWGAPGGDLAMTRHSKLADINTGNVNKLQMIWSQSSGTLRGHEGQPLVITEGGKTMMYMISGWPNIVQALDLADPDNPKVVDRRADDGRALERRGADDNVCAYAAACAPQSR